MMDIGKSTGYPSQRLTKARSIRPWATWTIISRRTSTAVSSAHYYDIGTTISTHEWFLNSFDCGDEPVQPFRNL